MVVETSIFQFAQLLKISPDGLLKLAKDISKNPKLCSLYNMSAANRLDLYLFLYECAIVEQKFLPLKRA